MKNLPTVRRNENPTPSTSRTRVQVQRTTTTSRPTTTGRRRQVQQEAMRRQAQQRPKQHVEYEEEQERSTPLLLKILSWLGIILLCFVLGYLGTSCFVDFMNKKLLLKPENRIENQEDLSNFEAVEQERVTQQALKSGESIKQISLNIYHVKNDTIAEARQNFISRTTEDNIRDAVSSVISLSGISGADPSAGADRIKLLHVFRDSDTAFLDMSGQFASALESAGQRKSLLLLTSIVRTLQENFSPISQVRFLVDSKPPKSGGVVDLSAPWKMPKKS